MQKTGAGTHLFYRYRSDDIRCSNRKIGPVLHIRAEGGYIIATLSIHPDTGTAYKFIDGHDLTSDNLVDAPEALMALLCELNKPSSVASNSAVVSSPKSGDHYGNAALQVE